jgi:nucleoside 2-deoxyribosyltransferase
MKIYLANGLFSEADFMYNEILYKELTDLGVEVYAPQKNTAINDKSKSADSIAIYNGDTEKLEWADAIVAVLDGLVIDPGVAAEIGYMAAKGKTILGLFTDSRENSRTVNDGKILSLKSTLENQFAYANLYVVGAVKKHGKIFNSREDLIHHVKQMASEDPIILDVSVFYEETPDDEESYSKVIKISKSQWNWYMGESGVCPKWEVISLYDLERYGKELKKGRDYLMEKLSVEMHDQLRSEYLATKIK